MVDLLTDDVTQLLPGEVTQDALGLVQEDAACQQALVDAVEEGQLGLNTERLSVTQLHRISSQQL